MSIEAEGNKFTWGDSVIIRKNSPRKFHPGEFASVCGLYKVESKERANELECKVGDWVYTVEFGNGLDIQVPECFLEKDFSIISGKKILKHFSKFTNGTISEINLGINSVKMKLKSHFVKDFTPENDIFLKDGFFVGKLSAIHITKFVMKNSNHVSQQSFNGNIQFLKLRDDQLELHVEWDIGKTTSLEIQASQFWWEPDLSD